MDTHGHEYVLILEVETGRGVPGVDMWLSGSWGGSNLRVGFGGVNLLSAVEMGCKN